MGVSEARHVDTDQLEFGRQVRAREVRHLTEDPTRRDFGGGVARPHQPVTRAVHGSALADGEDPGVGGEARRIGEHSPALPAVEAGIAGELVARPHPSGEDDHSSIHRLNPTRGVCESHLRTGG